MHFARLRADGGGGGGAQQKREGGKKSINIEISTLQAEREADYNERAWMMAKCQLPVLDATNSAYGGYANGLKPVF